MMVLLFWACVALGALAVLVYGIRSPDDRWAGDSRVKWLLVALVSWLMISRTLETQVSQICRETLDPLTLASAGRAFLECSPRLLSGGPVEVLIFGWQWFPPLLVAAISTRYLLRTARQHFSDHKEP